MSIKRMTDVWEYSKHKGSALLLMLALADIADDYGICWPGYEHLAHKIRMSRMSTMRLTDECQVSGELWKLTRSAQRSNVYIVTVGLTRDELQIAGEKALGLGVAPPMGSINLIPPPQVVGVVSRCYQVITKCYGVMIPVIPPSNIAMLPDPSLPVITQEEGIKDLWSLTLVSLQGQMGKDTFEAHLQGSTAIQNDGMVTVILRRAASLPWCERLRPIVTAALTQTAGCELALEFTAEEK